MTIHRLNGPWTFTEIEAYLFQSLLPIRLSAISAGGWPNVVSLWFIYQDGFLKCVSKPNSHIINCLKSNPRCGFEIAGESPPYFGVRGQANATLDSGQGPSLLPDLIDRYLGGDDTSFRRWLLAEKNQEIAILLKPRGFMSWDYRQRMLKN